MAEQTVQVFVRLRSDKDGEWFVHPDLRTRLIEDAHEQNTSLNDVAVQILARRVGLVVAPGPRRTKPTGQDAILKLRLPVDLQRSLGAAYGSKYQDGIRAILSAHYGLGLPTRRARSRARRRAA